MLPEYRGQGLARALVGELLAQERHDGVVVSALYPANSELYRQLGYEYGGLHPGFRALVVVRGPEGEVAGYASYFLENTGDNGYRVACKHLVALSTPITPGWLKPWPGPRNPVAVPGLGRPPGPWPAVPIKTGALPTGLTGWPKRRAAPGPKPGPTWARPHL